MSELFFLNGLIGFIIRLLMLNVPNDSHRKVLEVLLVDSILIGVFLNTASSWASISLQFIEALVALLTLTWGGILATALALQTILHKIGRIF